MNTAVESFPPKASEEAVGAAEDAGTLNPLQLLGTAATCVRLGCLSGGTRDLGGERKTPRQAVPNSGPRQQHMCRVAVASISAVPVAGVLVAGLPGGQVFGF